jgi:hypothetical protein
MSIYHPAIKNKPQIEMLRHIKFGHKYKDIEGIFTFIPYDVTIRDSDGNYMGTKDDAMAIFYLIGTFGSLDSDVIRINERLALDYVYSKMELEK